MSEYMWGAFVVIAIVAFSIAGAATVSKVLEGRHECKYNSDCSSTSYCGSDFKCHTFPQIENTIVNNDWTTPAAIVGLAIVLAAMILRRKQPQPRQFY